MESRVKAHFIICFIFSYVICITRHNYNSSSRRVGHTLFSKFIWFISNIFIHRGFHIVWHNNLNLNLTWNLGILAHSSHPSHILNLPRIAFWTHWDTPFTYILQQQFFWNNKYYINQISDLQHLHGHHGRSIFKKSGF